MSRKAMVGDLIRQATRQLKMPGLGRAFEQLARQAGSETWSYEEFLYEALSVEVTSRSESSVRSRMKAAQFPETKTLDEFDFETADGIDPAQLAELARGKWLDEGGNVLFAGPIGTGKSHLAIALGVEAARQRRHVTFHRAADLVCALREARDERELGRLHKRIRRVDLLILDEVGFVPFDREGGELLFNLMTDRYERRRSVLITTNLAFAEWPKVFGGDEKLTTALLDRLAERATIITTKGKSYRMRRRESSSKSKPTTQKTKRRSTSRGRRAAKG